MSDIGKAIIEGACNSEAKDLTLELTEIGLDSLMEEGVLKEIPMLKSIIACHKTWTAIHDQLFLRKVAEFLLACPKFTEAEKEEFSREHLNDPKKTNRLGEAIVLILDKLDDLEKPQMVAMAFAALVRRKIELETFRRLAAAIDIGFIGDLRALATQPFAHIYAIHSLLIRTGLVQIDDSFRVTKGAFAQSATATYRLNYLGDVFIGCMTENYDFNANNQQ